LIRSRRYFAGAGALGACPVVTPGDEFGTGVTLRTGGCGEFLAILDGAVGVGVLLAV
jgi:hypothetical protein